MAGQDDRLSAGDPRGVILSPYPPTSSSLVRLIKAFRRYAGNRRLLLQLVGVVHVTKLASPARWRCSTEVNRDGRF